ncbi:replication-associated recombination protein A [Vibrio harveyi]|uniref:replication-associated recombination protein A n=1 Tax=Vibrio harveyi TaxID=669 RepID=UPI003CFA41F5
MQNDLFSQAGPTHQPLAARIRPLSIADYFGQEHLTDPNKPLGRQLAQKQVGSMILWGTAGTGKTTLAKIIANNVNAHIIELSAVGSGVKEMRDAFKEAREKNNVYGKRTVLLVDEIHSFNKSQQDILLPEVESGLITLIGCTTENPSFSLNNALLSRLRVYVLKPHTKDSISNVISSAIRQVLTDDNGIFEVLLDDDVEDGIIDIAAGDARAAIGYLEALVDLSNQNGSCKITVGHLKEFCSFAGYDKNGDTHYNQLSALHKSIRGSDPDAALYWAARLVVQGCNPNIILRRLSAIASEDVGLADPQAITLVESCWRAYERTGDHEGLRAIGMCAAYLANSPKSNSIYKGWNNAIQLAEETKGEEVPLHIRNAPTKLMKELGHKEGYRYSHDEPYNYSAGQTYMPDSLLDEILYEPTQNGREKYFNDILAFRRNLDNQL